MNSSRPFSLRILFLAVFSLSACVDRVECTIHGDCASGEVCTEDFSCINGSKLDCKSNADCEGEQVCTLRGCVTTPDCTEDEQCGSGYQCNRYECQADDANDYAVELIEGGSARLALPEGATVLQPGASELVSVAAEGGALRFTAISCEQGQDTVYTQLQLADGSAETIATLVRLSDPAPPSAPSLQLVQTEIGAVEARFEVPPENGSGSCATHEFSLSWSLSKNDEASTQDSVKITEAGATVGQIITRTIPVPAGATLNVQLTAEDEAKKTATTTRSMLTSGLRVTEFKTFQTISNPGDVISVRYSVEGATSVELLRNGVTITERSSATGSWNVNVGALSSILQLRAYDGDAAAQLSQPLPVKVASQAEQEPNDDTASVEDAASVIAGRSSTTDVDYWRFIEPSAGGSLQLSTLYLSPDVDLQIDLLSADGELLETQTGNKPELSVRNLAAGAMYIRVTSSADAEYALGLASGPAECGNGTIETYAGESCDGGEDCAADCTLNLSSRRVRFPTQVEVHSRHIVFPLEMTEDGWIDVGMGQYAMNACPERRGVVELEDSTGHELSWVNSGGPSGCPRLIRAVPQGHYTLRVGISESSAQEFTLHYAAHDWGSCRDYVLNPLSEEQCDIGSENNGRTTCSLDCKLTSQDPPYYSTSDADACFPAQLTGPAPDGHNILRISCSQELRPHGPITTEVHVYDADRHYITHQTVVCAEEDSYVALPIDFQGTACIDANDGVAPHPVGQISTGILD